MNLIVNKIYRAKSQIKFMQECDYYILIGINKSGYEKTYTFRNLYDNSISDFNYAGAKYYMEDNQESIYTFYSTNYNLFTCLKAKDKSGLKFRVWETEDCYYEAELLNRQKFSLWNTAKTYDQLIVQLEKDFVDIWGCFVECELEELTEDAIEFRQFIKDNFELDRCDG